MNREQKIDALLGSGKVVATRHQFDNLTDIELDTWCSRVLGHVDGRVSRMDGGSYGAGTGHVDLHEDAELLELEKRFDASGPELLKNYAMSDPWRYGEAAAWAACNAARGSRR